MFHGGSFFKKRPPWSPKAKELMRMGGYIVF
jgi:hypothetical protein